MIIAAIQIISITALIIIAIPTILVSIEMIFSLLPTRTNNHQNKSAENVTSCILIPAHNEELVLSSTLSTIQPKLTESDNILVILDNCTDKSDEVCDKHGVDFVKRDNVQLRGKSYALDFGVQALGNEVPDVIVIIDADCNCQDFNLSKLKLKTFTDQQIVQSRYDMMSPVGASASTSVSAFAWYIKNHIRASGAKSIGMPCQVMGSGFAIPSATFRTIHLDNGSIAEDLLFGLECSKHNYFPTYLEESRVRSFFPTKNEAANTQSTRWIHGHLDIIFNHLWRYFLKALRDQNIKLLLQSIDAAFPPITLYFPLIIILSSISLIVGVELTVLLSLMLPTILFSFMLILIWFIKARNILPPSDITSVFRHLLLRVPKSLSFFQNRETSWVKTKRDNKDVDD